MKDGNLSLELGILIFHAKERFAITFILKICNTSHNFCLSFVHFCLSIFQYFEPDRYGVQGVSGVGIIHGHHFAHIITTDVHFLHSLVIVAELEHTASSRASFSNVILK